MREQRALSCGLTSPATLSHRPPTRLGDPESVLIGLTGFAYTTLLPSCHEVGQHRAVTANVLLVDLGIAILAAIIVLTITPGVAVAAAIALVVLSGCAVGFRRDSRRRRARGARRPTKL